MAIACALAFAFAIASSSEAAVNWACRQFWGMLFVHGASLWLLGVVACFVLFGFWGVRLYAVSGFHGTQAATFPVMEFVGGVGMQ